MSVVKVGPGDIEVITLQTSPAKTFLSKSNMITALAEEAGITGSVKVFAEQSSLNKEMFRIGAATDNRFDASDPDSVFNFFNIFNAGARNTSGMHSWYLSSVNAFPESPLNNLDVNVIRFEPSLSYTSDTNRKLSIINGLYPRHRVSIPTSNYAYTNYHCLNFFTASNIPGGAALLYPNSSSAGQPQLAGATRASGSYNVNDAFTFEFFIKPRNYQARAAEYHPGTIMHLSSAYAVSLISGSSRDGKSRADTFAIRLQLSHSADYPPNQMITGSGAYPKDLIFDSNDVLKKDSWHHVAIRWGFHDNNSTGEMIVDGVSQGEFYVPSKSLNLIVNTAQNEFGASALAIGNYYQGSNKGDSRQSLFFATRSAARDGVRNMEPNNNSKDKPDSFTFSNPLCAEIHDIRIFNDMRTNREIEDGRHTGLSHDEPGLAFYLQPLFLTASTIRTPVGGTGGVLQTPFNGVRGSTIDPFNIALSYGVGGHYLNLENFTMDVADKNYPRLHDLTASQIAGTTNARSCNDFLYTTGAVRFRNLLVLPCDNGDFIPNLSPVIDMGRIFNKVRTVPIDKKIKSGSAYFKYRDDSDVFRPDLISLRNLVPSKSFVDYINRTLRVDEDGNYITGEVQRAGESFENEVLGPSPEEMGVSKGQVLTVFQRTRDNSSNEVTFFDVSNLFYGQKIKPGSIELTDLYPTGAFNTFNITLKDDGHGNLYRANSNSKHATWNSVGNVFYDYGILAVKSPNLPLFGKDGFSIKMRGENSIHVMKIDVLAQDGMINSSSNVNYLVASASESANDANSKFVAITGINFHDDNLNVIMKSKFAQPVIKRDTDRILFRSKLDF